MVEKSGIGSFAGEIITKLDDMQLLVPRGKNELIMYSNHLKLHGKTHDYKILYKDINRAFLLPRPDGVHMNYIISLRSPLRQGQTQHHYLVLQFKKEREEKLKLNLTEEEVKEKYGDELSVELEGPLYDVLSRLFKSMIKISIIVPSGFKSEKGTDAVKCSVKAQDGYLYPLNKSFLFIHKPVSYIRHEDIVWVEFNRISEFSAAGRSFDINIVTKKTGTMSFTGISKQEYKPLVEYLKSKNKIKCRNGDDEGKIMDLDNMDVIQNPSRNNRRAMVEIDDDEAQLPAEGEDSEGEDESFDIGAQEAEDSELESNGSVSLLEEEDDTKKKPSDKGKDKKVKSEEESKE
jgi:structure-specific recognition protein 1